jgi:hypothetical protein
MAFGGTLSPIKYANAWMRFDLNGVTSPGTIPRGGIRGFKRATGWDKKRGKGTKGATLTLKDQPPAEGSITLQLFTTQEFADWDNFVATVLSIPADKQKAEGLSIWHPALQSVGITNVVIESFSPPDHQGKGLYHVVIELYEWQQPPAVSVVSTVDAAATNQAGGDQNLAPPPDPRIVALEAQIGLLTQAASAP